MNLDTLCSTLKVAQLQWEACWASHAAHEQVDVLVHIQVLEPLGVARQLHQQAAVADVDLLEVTKTEVGMW
jgi:hypothetical protein